MCKELKASYAAVWKYWVRFHCVPCHQTKPEMDLRQVKKFVIRSLSSCKGQSLFSCALENTVRLYRLIYRNAILLGNRKTKQLKKARWLLHLKKEALTTEDVCWCHVTFVQSVFSHSLVHCMSCTVGFSEKKNKQTKNTSCQDETMATVCCHLLTVFLLLGCGPVDKKTSYFSS